MPDVCSETAFGDVSFPAALHSPSSSDEGAVGARRRVSGASRGDEEASDGAASRDGSDDGGH
eukprot:gene36210-46673_t